MSDTSPREVTVELEMSGLTPGKAVTLRSFASPHDSRPAGLSVTDSRGAAVAVTEPAVAEPGAAAPAAFTAPASGVAHVRYRVVLGGRRGNANEGFEHARTSSVNDRFALLRGRDLFLLSDPPTEIGAVSVSFRLPDDWRAWASWAPEGAPGGAGAKPIERRGHDEIEELIAAPLALGRFDAERVRVAACDVNFIVESGLSDADRDTLREDLVAAIRSLERDMPKPLGREYAVIVVPRTPEGDEVDGAAWSTGQGATLHPLTFERLRAFARRLIAARLQYATPRPEFRDPRDAWVPYALRERLSLDVVADVRGIDAGSVDRFLSHGYATMPGDRRDLLDLERVCSGLDGDVPLEERQLSAARVAPHLLRALEREMGGREALRAWLHRMLGRDAVASFWDEVPLEREARERLRAEWARGGALLPVDFGNEVSEIAMKPAGSAAAGGGDAAAGGARPVTRTLRVALTSQSLGYLENCGCKVNQSGGLARRSTLVQRLRRSGAPLLLVDAGSGLNDPGLHPDPDAFDRAEQGLYQRLVARMDYAALVPGHTDLSRGAGAFDSLRTAAPLPYVSANVLHRDGSAVAPPMRTVDLDGIRCHVIGVYTPWNPFQQASSFEEVMNEYRLGDPVEAVRRATAKIPARDLVVVAGEIPYRVIREIARACPDVDLILASPQIFFGELAPKNASGSSQNDWPGFLGNTAVVYGDLGSYGVSGALLRLDGEGRVVDAEFQPYELNEEIPEDPAMRAALDDFYARLSPAVLADAAVRPPAAALAVADAGSAGPAAAGGAAHAGWVGAAACADCHEKETTQWHATPHASAMRTLTKVRRDRQPKCVSCHVVGFGTPGGYRTGGPMGESTAHLAGVQCEACHGPGRAHADDPTTENIAREVPEGVCVACHDAEHSDFFDYSARLPHVIHGTEGAATARSPDDPDALPAARIVQARRK